MTVEIPPPDPRLRGKANIIDLGQARDVLRVASPGGAAEEDGQTDSEIRRLASLSALEYERERILAAERLGCRTSFLDQLVKAKRGQGDDDARQGRAFRLPEPEPWPEQVRGADLLSDISSAIRSHVVMSAECADAAALWVLHTYLLDVSGISPRLAITSPEKGCGKTTALDVLGRLAFRPLSASNITPASVFRIIEKSKPCLLIDEADTFLKENDQLKGILNSGHRRSGSVIRCEGDDNEPVQFSTYAATAIAMIGRLPATLEDRSIAIELRRRRSDEEIEEFDFDKTPHLDQLARKATRWAEDNRMAVAEARARDGDPPQSPEG